MSKHFYTWSTAIITTWNNSINSDERGHVCNKDKNAPAGQTDDTNIRCIIPVPGRYVKIARTGAFWSRESYLSFGEVKFYGYLYRREFWELHITAAVPTIPCTTYCCLKCGKSRKSKGSQICHIWAIRFRMIRLTIIMQKYLFFYFSYILFQCPPLWPSGIGSRLGRNRL